MTYQHDCCSSKAATEQQGIAPTPVERMRSWATSRQGVIVIGLAAIVLAMAFSWNWLVAIGAASLILSFAPCAIMCTLGVCMTGRGKSSNAKQTIDRAVGQPNAVDLSDVSPAVEKPLSLPTPSASQPAQAES